MKLFTSCILFIFSTEKCSWLISLLSRWNKVRQEKIFFCILHETNIILLVYRCYCISNLFLAFWNIQLICPLPFSCSIVLCLNCKVCPDWFGSIGRLQFVTFSFLGVKLENFNCVSCRHIMLSVIVCLIFIWRAFHLNRPLIQGCSFPIRSITE